MEKFLLDINTLGGHGSSNGDAVKLKSPWSL